MDHMFNDCIKLSSLDVSNFDTSQVTDMAVMFCGCKSLPSLDVSGFDTSQVTNMRWMFSFCESLPSLDVSNFDTSKVTDMGVMFRNCIKLTSLDVGGFDTSQVTDMDHMFYSCIKLSSLDVSNFDTSQVTNMGAMFCSCRSLPSLDVSNFETSQVTNMNSMFSGCESLPSLDVSNFDTSQVTDMEGMFNSCRSLPSLDVSNFETSQVTSMSSMFGDCRSLLSLDVSNFDTGKVTQMLYMFINCESLTSLNLSSFYVVGDSRFMLDRCSCLTTIYTPYYTGSSVALPIDDGESTVWYQPDGTTVTELPKGLGYSIILKKNKIPEVSRELTARKKKTVYHPGEHITLDDLTVGYYSEDGKITTLQDGYTTNVDELNADMNTLGSRELTVSYEGLSASVTLVVSKILTEEDVIIEMPEEPCVYDGSPKTPVPAVSLKEGGTALKNGEDFMLSYYDNINAGVQARVMIKLQNKYQGTMLRTFAIEKASAPEAKTAEQKIPAADGGQKEHVLNLAELLADWNDIEGYTLGQCREDDAVSGDVLSGMPSITNGVLTYHTAAGAVGDFAEIPISVHFLNYKSSTLTVTVKMVTQNVQITLTGTNSRVYNGNPENPVQTVKVGTADGRDITDSLKDKLICTYSGTQADGSVYAASSDAPVNAGSYKLTVAVAQDDKNYTGSAEYPFTIVKAPLTITARDMGLKIGAELPKAEDYQFDIAGLLEGDTLKTNPTLFCSIADTTAAGEYEITVSGADAGMNYDITYKNGTLTVSEAGETAKYYTVTFNLSGKGSDITNTGVKEGSLLEQPQEPQADGYTFTGWYKDSACTVLWDFAKDTVQSDTALYAGWKAKDNDKDDDNQDDSNDKDPADKDDSAFTDTERTPLSAVGAAIANIKARVYDGSAYEPAVKVTANINGKKTTLTEGMDYRVLYKDHIKAGTATVIIKGNGIYKGSVSKTYTISPRPVKKLKVITGSIAEAQTGTDLAALPVYVYDGAKRLSYGTDFTLTGYSAAGQVAQVTVSGKGNYAGSMTAKLSIYNVSSDKLINPSNVGDIQPMTYNAGKALKPEPVVTAGGTRLVKNKDYKVQYQNNKNAGTAYVIVTGKGAYRGKVVVPFTIKAAQGTSGVTVKPISAKTYNGKYQRPAPTVTVSIGGKNKKLVKNKDYTVTYKNNRHAGTAEVIVTGKGNYAGMTAKSTFTINPQKITKASLKGTQGNLTLTYSKGILKQGTDYEQPIYGEVQKNKIKVTIKGKGDFTGTMTKSVKM